MLQKLAQKLHILILLYAGFNMFTFWQQAQTEIENLEMRIPAMQGRISKAKRELKQLKNYSKDVEDARQKIELVAQEVERTQRQLPADISDIENINLLRSVADGMNIKDVTVTPMDEQLRSFYYVKKYEVRGYGTFLQFMIFFEKIAENERLLNINEIKLERRSEGQRGRFQVIDAEVIVEAYRYNPDHKEDRGIKETANAASD